MVCHSDGLPDHPPGECESCVCPFYGNYFLIRHHLSNGGTNAILGH